jgi:hypothetical protein
MSKRVLKTSMLGRQADQLLVADWMHHVMAHSFIHLRSETLSLMKLITSKYFILTIKQIVLE